MIRPWEIEPESYSYSTRWGVTANCVNEVIEDTFGNSWKRGDIVKFGSGYWDSYNYKNWFLNEEDKRHQLTRDTRIPKYAINQYAILMTRYRVMKNKEGSIFRDYGSHIMILTGQKTGKLRRYFSYTPYSLVGSFPYNNIANFVKKMLTDIGALPIATSINTKYGNTPKSRTLFLELLQNKIGEE
jgi:hypothetical protein